MKAADLTYADVLKIYTGPTEERRGRPWRPMTTLKVDAVEGTVVTFMQLGYEPIETPFFSTKTFAEIDAILDAAGGEIGTTDLSSFAPRGECSYCDKQRDAESTFFPSHNASGRCRSGGYNHCTCDACF